jgi:PAS domain S-box-containing protein
MDSNLVRSVRASPIAMVVTNPRLPDNPIEIANQAFFALTGYDEREVIGRNCRFLGGLDTSAAVRDQIRQAVRNEQAFLAEILNYRRDGTPFRNGVMIAPLFDDAGRLAFFLGSQVDLGSDGPSGLMARRSRARAMVESLPPRQRQVLEGIAAGLLNKQIAYRLGNAEKTVKMHRALLLERLGGISSAEAIRIAVEADL